MRHFLIRRATGASAIAAAALYCLAGATPAAAQAVPPNAGTQAGPPETAAPPNPPEAAANTVNPFNDELLKMSPADRAAFLAERIGFSCIGTDPFLMGITRSGPARGFAYWSLKCAGGDSYAVQIDPEGHGVVTDCATLKQNGNGRECFRKF